MYVNAEYRFPIGGRLSGAVFIDAGQVFANGRNALSVDKLRVTPGAGLRVDSPLGPVRLDVAYSRYGPTPGRLFRQSGNVLELVPQPGDGLYTPAGGGVFGHLRIHFSIGQAF
jgi:outer membrane protein insertion porin family